MAIQFARIEIINRKNGGNACCKGAYNSRGKVNDQQNGITFNFSNRGDNVYHNILLPEGIDEKFKESAILMNAIESAEKRKNSQLLKDIVVALPDDKELNLEDRINITNQLIEDMEWVQNGLALQVDIHKPHDGEKNWHAHILVPTRRFKECGTELGEKARDLNPEFKTGAKGNFIVPEEDIIHEKLKRITNEYFKKLGLDNRVDEISTVPQEHIGPVRMRNVLNQAIERNHIRAEAHIDNMKNGEALLKRVTRTQSVFTLQDLERGVKDIPNITRGAELVKEALKSSNLLPLYKEDQAKSLHQSKQGEYKETIFFTTREVRQEEATIIRLAEKISKQRNYSGGIKTVDAINHYENVSDTQREALKHLLLTGKGLRIIRGRAGTGKSHLLAALHQIATERKQRVIGLAPTHKAKIELEAKGFKDTQSVKGFLFAVKNNRFDLRARSTIVVDEAGMVGNRDLQELLRCAHHHNCNVILAGDERQLTSVERGGMFEELAERHGSSELSEIRRQAKSWGREMASHFAKGNTNAGIDVLVKNDGIRFGTSKADSMANLIRHWSKSKFNIKNRLIVSVKNEDVRSLNDGIREYLKKSGALSGREICIDSREVIGNKTVDVKRSYMSGDRILFASTKKSKGILNGELATLKRVNKDKFVAELDCGREVEFDPKEIFLKHGYAVTVFKSQGATIEDVYMLHSGAGNCRTSYVGLTRFVREVMFFCNVKNTKNIDALKRQLDRKDGKSCSLGFYTKSDIKKLKYQNSKLLKIGSWFKDVRLSILDNLVQDHEYYKFDKADVSIKKVEEVLEEVAREVANDDIEEILAEQDSGLVVSAGAAGNSQYKPRVVKSSKQKFYDNADSKRSVERKNNNSSVTSTLAKRDYKKEYAKILSELRFQSEKVAFSLFGEDNKSLSNGPTLRYGRKGSFTILISGERAGTWYDFEKGEGGSIFKLVMQKEGLSFEGAIDHLNELLELGSQNLQLVVDNESREKYKSNIEADQKAKEEEVKKIKDAKDLYEKSKKIVKQSIATRYLSKHRAITIGVTQDIKTTGIWDKETQKRYPAIVAFARNAEGEITGGQKILLDPKSYKKAAINVPKKSFGKIGGSFVHVQNALQASKSTTKSITYIAEGLETALSLREAKLQGKILCSLGIGNIKKYSPVANEKIIIAADNDGENSSTGKVIEEAKKILENKGAVVRIVAPEKEGDFNDLLKLEGSFAVRERLIPSIRNLNNQIDNVRLTLGSQLKDNQKPVLLVEGAQSAKVAQKLMPDYAVVSWVGGVSGGQKNDWEQLVGRNVVILPSNDQSSIDVAASIKRHMNDLNKYEGLVEVIDVDKLKLPTGWCMASNTPSTELASDIKSKIDSLLIKNQDIGAIEFEEGFGEKETSGELVEMIRNFAHKVLEKQGKSDDRDYVDRLDKELDVIEKTGFAKDFILAHQVCMFAKQNNIEIGSGRGSAVSSLTAHLLGIHKVDPVKNGLLFERFLTPDSKKQPDFDIDVAKNCKGKIEAYLFGKYEQASKIEVRAKNGQISTHPAAVVLVEDALKKEHNIETRMVKTGGAIRPRISVDKHDADSLSIRKIDLLSSSALEKVVASENEIASMGGKIDWDKINWNDQATFTLLNQGRLREVYQFGSEYASKVFNGIKISSFDDIVNLQALVRPGASKSVDKYKRNKDDETKLFKDHRNILGPTRGVILFQEQIMQIAETYLGVGKSKTNDFRRDLVKFAALGEDKKEQQQNLHRLVHKDNFIEAAKVNGGLDKHSAAKLYYAVIDASKFSYNKSHAIAYSMISFKTAYLKANHPEIFNKHFKCREASVQHKIDMEQQDKVHNDSKAKALEKSKNDFDMDM